MISFIVTPNHIKKHVLVGFRRAVIFSVKEYTNNELTKTKNKKKQNKTK